MDASHQVTGRKPPWLKVRLPSGEGYRTTLRIAREKRLHTVCEDSLCPNIADCWGRKTATFMILGDVCTRSCGFCAVKSGRPTGLDWDEPRRTAEAVRELGIRHAVITSVNRDELPDGGASLFAETIRQIRLLSPGTRVEVLTPDFLGRLDALEKVWEARPDVHAHNIECVPRLQRQVRSAATYERSRRVLEETRKRGIPAKTGLQVGHGETWDEILWVFDDLARIGLEILTIGQYLRPTPEHLPVRRYYTPEEFARLAEEARARGIRYVQSGPLVRSSYRAEEPFEIPAPPEKFVAGDSIA
ncbi:MAG: lipoyl synthase [Planctomycetota bacterium]